MISTILVVDDAPAIHALLSVAFFEQPIEMHSAYDGPSAVESLRRVKPDLILLDVNMPGMSGFDVCSVIREDPFTMNVPVIFLTAADSTRQKVTGLDLGAQDYIVKPFDPNELLARVRSALRTKASCDTLGQKRVSQFMRDALRSREIAA